MDALTLSGSFLSSYYIVAYVLKGRGCVYEFVYVI